VRRRIPFEATILVTGLCLALPALLTVGSLLWQGDYSRQTSLLVLACLLALLAATLAILRHKVRFPLQTLANLVSALREGDFSIRARGKGTRDALGELAGELNLLSGQLREQRLGGVEASALLRTVMAEIDVAIFAFDAGQRLVLLNRAAEKVLARSVEQVLGRTAAELGLEECLQGEANRTLTRAFPGGGDRWSARRGTFRQGGWPHQLVALTDLSRTLREEERRAWQRLVRVLGHELNNSLAPIKSIAGSLENLLQRDPRPADCDEDVRRGLSVIASRTASLTRFMEAYARLAKLPAPQMRPVALEPLIRRAAGLEQRLAVAVDPGAGALLLDADSDQLEQLLINLIRNAVDAVLEEKSAGPGQGRVGGGEPAGAGVGASAAVRWAQVGGQVDILIEDSGPGLANPANAFVPFFTTKPGGTGIGLVLCRQIAEAHGGTLTLENRTGQRGCVARLRLPLAKRTGPAAG